MPNKFDITEKEFSEWLKHPCTEAYIEFIKEQMEARKEIAANGGCLQGKGFSDIGQNYIAQMNTISIYDSMLEDIQQFEIIVPSLEETENHDGTSQESIGQ